VDDVYKVLLALHLLFAIFAIGPLVHAATTAGRGVRRKDGIAALAAARTLRVYAYASVLVVLVGFALMSLTDPDHNGQHVGQFTQTWIWLSTVLWAAAIVLVLLVLVPTLQQVGELIGRQQPVAALTARVAATGGIVGLIFAGIVFLMVYQPGR
jgi:hypothetical protein